MTSKIGTILYMAPELFLSNQYGTGVDVFSFGLSMWVILKGTGEEPYADYLVFEIPNAIIGRT